MFEWLLVSIIKYEFKRLASFHCCGLLFLMENISDFSSATPFVQTTTTVIV